MFRLHKLEITGFKSFADHTELVFTDGITAVVGPNGCGKCVSGDTLVTLADGREMMIRRLVEDALSSADFTEQMDDGELTRENPHEVEILSLNPDTLQLEPRRVSAFVKRTATSHLLRVRTRAGREITATPYHPLFTLRDGRLHALRADELAPGVRVAVPRCLPTKHEPASTRFDATNLFSQLRGARVYLPATPQLKAWAAAGRAQHDTYAAWARAAAVPDLRVRNLLGKQAVSTDVYLQLAAHNDTSFDFDGKIKSHGSGVMRAPSSSTPDLARFLGLLIAEGRNTSANQVWFVNSDANISDEYERLARELFGVQVSRRHYKPEAEDSLIYSRSLGIWLERVCGFKVNSKSNDKRVPPFLFTASEDEQWAFLSGLFEGDAYICARHLAGKARPHAYIEYATASETLAREVISLLLQLGIFAVLRRKEKYASNTTARIKREYFSVLIYGANQLRRAAEHLSFVGMKREALQHLRGLPATCNPNHDLVPMIAPLVRQAVREARVKVKANRRQCPKLAAYAGAQCAASREGLHEVAAFIQMHGATPALAASTLESLRRLAASDVYWDEVVSVERASPPDEWVYDLSVAGTHNFVAGNLVVHNSNVAEGIAWVLGEQRAKSLRGGEMKDVIFAGTRNRSASGMAEVVLHLVRTDEDEDIEGVGEIDSTLEEIDDEDAAVMMATDAEAVSGEAMEAGLSETSETIGTGATSETAAMMKARGRRHWRRAKTSISFAPGETVSVTRRLYRSGESEYLLNNRACRLRDIQDLFSGTGLSGAHYAIIEQGRIGQILSAKPMDRRVLIEEAAGITKFRVRQRAVEARLEGARGNLSRIADIVSEIERQAGSLRRQAAKARRYTQLRDELRELLRQVYQADYHTLTAALDSLRVNLSEAHEEEKILIAGLTASEAAAREATALARESEERLAAERLRASDAMLQRDRQAREYAYKEQQATSLEERLATVRAESATLRERLTQRASEAETLRAGEVELRTSSEEAAQLLQAAEAAYTASLAAVAGVETEIEKLRHELLTHTAVAERLMEIGRQLDAALDRLRFQAEGLEREGERAHAAHEVSMREAAEFDVTLTEARTRLAALLAEREAATVAVASARGTAHEAAHAHAGVQNEFVQVRHRLDALAELDRRRALYTEAVQRLFTADTDEKNFTHRGTLADELRVEPRYEQAVETIIGAYLQAVIVPTPEDAVRAAAWLDANDAGRANFLVTGLRGASDEGDASKAKRGRRGTTTDNGTSTASAVAVLDEDENGDMGAGNMRAGNAGAGDAGTGDAPRLGSLLGASPEIVLVLERALNREMNARVVLSLDDAMAESLVTGATFVTMRGECVMGGTLVAAGNTVTSDGDRDAGLLSFKREMRELEIRVDDLEGERTAAKSHVDEANTRVGELEDVVVLLNEVVGRAERDVVQSEMNETRLRADIERAARHIRVVADDAARLAEEIKELEERRATSERDAHAAENARQAVTAQVAEVTVALATRRRAAEGAGESLSDARAAAATAAERRRAAAADLRRIEVEMSDLENRLERFAAEVDTGVRRLVELRDELAAIESNAATYDEQQAAHEQLVETRTSELFQAREQADTLAATLNELHARAAASRDMRSALAIQQAETGARLNYLHEACMAELAANLDELAKLDDASRGDFDVAAARARIEELRVRIENLGAINMMALEELAEADERLEFLIKQRKDIVDGITATEEALREIKRRSRERFREAFEAVNQNFGELFAELFGGGRGEMTLIDTQDVLESGIDLIAQPPGKRLQNVLLLSGGEKAMAALALLIAVFRYRPSPFCLLDEVDAPLDEANTGRFTKKIAEMSEHTQFIIITHNKRTMEVARALYGVTMQDAGISKLVSAKFE